MPAVDVQRAGYDNSVNILLIEQAPVVIKRLNGGRHVFGFVPASRVNVGDGDELGVRNSQHLFEQFLSASTHTDHPHTHAVICAEHSRGWIDEHRSRTQGTPFYEITPRVLIKRSALGTDAKIRRTHAWTPVTVLDRLPAFAYQ